MFHVSGIKHVDKQTCYPVVCMVAQALHDIQAGLVDASGSHSRLASARGRLVQMVTVHGYMGISCSPATRSHTGASVPAGALSPLFLFSNHKRSRDAVCCETLPSVP